MLAAGPSQWSLPVVNPVLTFALVMCIILIAPMIMQRLRAPGMIGMILAGIVVGPHALNILQREGAIADIGAVGLLFIMLVAGLEIDLHRFRRYRGHSLAFGSISYLVPQVLGTAVALWLLNFGWAEAILLGSMFGSHTLLTYPIASRLGIASMPAVTTAVGGTIITDSAALLVLAVVARSANGTLDLAFWVTLLSSLTVYTAAVWWGLPWVARWFFRTVPSEGTSHFVFIMAAGFLCAYFAEVAGVVPIIGAFLAGLALNRLIPNHGALMNRIEFAGRWFFIPVFLLSVGMLADPRVFVRDIETMKVAAVMVVTVIATKLLAAVIARRLLGYGSDEGWVIFGLSVNQAAATLAAVMVGVRVEIFDETVLNGAIMMILVTCILGPWVTQRFGRRLAASEALHSEDRAAAPQRMLIPLRNPQAADAIMDVALLVREKESPEPLFPLTVVLDDDDASAQVAAAERMLGHAVMYAAGANVPVVPVTRLDNNAAAGVLRAARELRISTIVMGWTGRGSVRNRVFGSVLDQLLESSSQQFIVCRLRSPLNAAQRLVLLVPRFADHEVGFRDAVVAIKTLAQRAGLDLVVAAEEAELAQLRITVPAVTPDVETVFVAVRSVASMFSHPIASSSIASRPVVGDRTPAFGSTRPADARDGGRDGTGTFLRADDLLVLLGARSHRVSWSPAIDRLPGLLVSQFPEMNLIVVYPTELADDAAASLGGARELRQLLRSERICLALDADSPRGVIDHLLETWFDGRDDVTLALGAELDRAVVDSAIDLAPGIVLIHAHSARVQQAMAFLATTTKPVRFPRSGHHGDVVILLLTPTSLDPAVHLQHLATIARLLQGGDAAARIRAASSPEEIRDLFEQASPMR